MPRIKNDLLFINLYAKEQLFVHMIETVDICFLTSLKSHLALVLSSIMFADKNNLQFQYLCGEIMLSLPFSVDHLIYIDLLGLTTFLSF